MQASKKANYFICLTQAGFLVAIKKIWSRGVEAYAIRISPECSFKSIRRMDNGLAQRKVKELQLNQSGTPQLMNKKYMNNVKGEEAK